MDTAQERARTRFELRHPLPSYEPEEAVCGNCEHWDVRAAERMGIASGLRLAPCAMRAVRLDGAGQGGLVLCGPDNHCREYDEAFEPSQDFVSELLGRISPAA